MAEKANDWRLSPRNRAFFALNMMASCRRSIARAKATFQNTDPNYWGRVDYARFLGELRAQPKVRLP